MTCRQAFPDFLDKAGFYTFFFFCGINIFLAIFCWIWVPETKSVPLEEIDTVSTHPFFSFPGC